MRRIHVKCIICPIGCDITVTLGENKVLSIEGNGCPRGLEYARNEILNPRRYLMTVVRVRNGDLPVVSVKSSKPIPKKLIKRAMMEIAKIEVKAPIRIGDIIIKNLLGLDVNIIATREVKKIDKKSYS